MAMKQPTTTQIRNFYSPGCSYLNVSFYNNGLSLRFSPSTGRDNNGRDHYDMNNAETTVINPEKAFALYELTKNIVDHKIQGCKLEIDTNGGKLTFIYNGGGNVPILTLEKNGKKIEFKFEMSQAEVMVDGKKETRYLNSMLGVFMKTLDGYLSGINSDRHLDKLTENYVASLQKDGKGNNQRGGGYGGKGGGYNRNNGGGYQKKYNGGGSSYNNNNAPVQPAQNLDNYELPF